MNAQDGDGDAHIFITNIALTELIPIATTETSIVIARSASCRTRAVDSSFVTQGFAIELAESTTMT